MAGYAAAGGSAAAGPTGALDQDEDVRRAYAAHGAELYRFALRSLGDAGAAQDAVQDASEVVIRSWVVEEGLRRIGDDHRDAIIQTYLLDRSYHDVAAEMGIPTSTLRSRVFYGLKALRVVLEEMGVEL